MAIPVVADFFVGCSLVKNRPALDFPTQKIKEKPMKKLFLLLTLALSVARMDASVFTLDGDLSYEITEPRLTFKLEGDLKNASPAGSGTIKLVLWATPGPFPSAGYIVGEYTLGSLAGGYQFSDFSVRTTSKVPTISGTYHFTIAVAEFTDTGWRNVLAVSTGTRQLVAGNFPEQKKWTLPNKTVTQPFALIQQGDIITLKQKATVLLNVFPAGPELRTTLTVRSTTKLAAKNSLGKWPLSYKYKMIQDTYLKKKVPAGQLTFEYPASSGKPKTTVVLTLYFQGSPAGIYRSVETSAGRTETTWGSFSF